MKKILVTGSSGVLGSSFKEEKFTENKKYNFEFLDSRKEVDLRNLDNTINFFNKSSPNYVINLAAVSGGIGLSSKYHASLLRDNALICFNVLEACRRINIEKVIMTLSTGMYPKLAKLPYNEKDIHTGDPLENNYGYSFGKRIIEPSIRAYRSEYELNAIGLILSGIYGENDNFNLNSAPMLPATINKIYNAKYNNEICTVWGDGSQLRELTYSKDIRNIYIWFLENYSSENCVNISSGEELAIKDIVKIICEEFDYDFNLVKFDVSKPKGILKKTTDISLQNSLNKFDFVKFKDGIKEVVKWYKKNIKNLRLDNKKNEF